MKLYLRLNEYLLYLIQRHTREHQNEPQLEQGHLVK